MSSKTHHAECVIFSGRRIPKGWKDVTKSYGKGLDLHGNRLIMKGEYIS